MNNTNNNKRKYVIDVIFVLFLIFITLKYNTYISAVQIPMWDANAYLTNARNWLSGEQLFENYRPPLLSWIIAGIWAITGENWVLVKPLSAIFVIGAGILLYIIIRKHKGELFALAVVVLTMTNANVFLFDIHIYTEGLSLFLLVSTLFLLKSDNENHWYLAGITIGLTFASRYPIIIQAITILFVEYMIRKNPKILTRVFACMIPIILIMISIVYMKNGTFQMSLAKDSNFSILLSPYYVINSIDIWGLVFLLVPISFLFKDTYRDKYNYTFICWFIVSLIFWSANIGNRNYRFTIQFTPAVYYLAILTIENMTISKISINSIMNSIKNMLNSIKKFIEY